MILLPGNYSLNINGIEQRLIQIFAYFISENFLHELMYLGMIYSFKYNTSLNLENIKGNFYISSLIQYKNIINNKLLFKFNIFNNYKIIKYNSFNLFKKFYSILNKINPILNILNFIINTESRSNKIQYQQIIGMRGLLTTSRKYITKFPLLYNFDTGLNVIEYIMSSYGVRKGLLDTSIQTAESGYLTRRLVEIVQDIVLKEQNCGSNMFLILTKYNDIKGNLCFPNFQLLFNKYIHYNLSNIEFYIKSPILCYSGRMFCNNCLGFSYNTKVLKGESIGIISGESLGEPTTQLTLRTFHTGGVLNINKIYDFNICNYKFNYKLFSKYLKISNLIFIKKIYKNIFPILNKYKFILVYNNKFIKTLYNKYININFKIKYKYSNLLIIYKFNNIIQFPIINSFIKYNYIKLNICYDFNIFINFYSINILLKNILNEWVFLSLTNDLNYININLNIYYIGGLNFRKTNLIKSYIIFNKSLIY